MSELSNFSEEAIVRHLLSITTWTPVAGCWVALWVGNPTDTGLGGAEVDQAGYARQEVESGEWTILVGNAENNQTISFGPAAADWGNVDYCAIMSAETSGDFLAYTELDNPKNPTSGDTVEFANTTLTVDID